jgi:hypothetical protein
MGIQSFPVVAPGSLTDTWDPTTNARGEPGQIFFSKNASGEWSVVEIVQLDNNGCALGEVLMQNHATLKGYSVRVAATTDEGAPIKGIAAAAIGSQKCGYAVIGGYCESAQLSHTAASGEYLCVSGSVAGELTPNKASCFNLVTNGNSSQIGVVATGTGSIQILGIWG